MGGGTKIVELVGGYKDCWNGGRDKDCWEGGRAQTVQQFKVQKGDWDEITRVLLIPLISSCLLYFQERPCNKHFYDYTKHTGLHAGDMII